MFQLGPNLRFFLFDPIDKRFAMPAGGGGDVDDFLLKYIELQKQHSNQFERLSDLCDQFCSRYLTLLKESAQRFTTCVNAQGNSISPALSLSLSLIFVPWVLLFKMKRTSTSWPVQITRERANLWKQNHLRRGEEIYQRELQIYLGNGCLNISFIPTPLRYSIQMARCTSTQQILIRFFPHPLL